MILTGWIESPHVLLLVLVCFASRATCATTNYTIAGGAAEWTHYLTDVLVDDQAWSANCSRCGVFLHHTYVVAYLKRVDPFDTETPDYVAVSVWPVCPNQYLPPTNFQANATAVPPVCIAPASYFPSRNAIEMSIVQHLRSLLEAGMPLFDYRPEFEV